MAELGLQNFTAMQFRKQNGSIAQVRLGTKVGECLVQVEPIIVHQYGSNGEGEDEEDRMVVVSEQKIGYKVSLSKNDRIHI